MSSPSSSVRILVMRLSAMGDVAMTVPVLRRLLLSYPEIRLTILTRPFFSSIFENMPRTNVVVANTDTHHKGAFGIFRLARELSSLDFDMAVDLHDVLRTKLLRFILCFYGIRTLVLDKGRSEKKELTRPTNKVFKQLKTMHQRYAEVFNNIGFPFNPYQKITVEKSPLPESVIINRNKKIVGIAPFAAHASKQYPIDSIKIILEGLSKENEVKLFLFGGKEEIDQLSLIAQEDRNIELAAGKLNFSEELQLISNLDLMISMDSSNGHLAAMFDVPVITVWGGTHPYTGFAPYAQLEANQFTPDLEKFPYLPNSVFGNKSLEEYDAIMRSIDPIHILIRAKELLKINT